MKKVTVYSRSGCHLCEIAIDRIKSTMDKLKFELDIKLIDDDLK
jgi:glutaredoxin